MCAILVVSILLTRGTRSCIDWLRLLAAFGSWVRSNRMDSLWCASVLHIRLLRTLYTRLNKATHTIYISSAQHYMIKYESHVCIVQYNNTCLRMGGSSAGGGGRPQGMAQTPSPTPWKILFNVVVVLINNGV